jgi:uncharacterized membrane protein YgcG
MPLTSFTPVFSMFFTAITALALLTSPASAQKLIRNVNCSSSCDHGISCFAKVPGGVHDNERALLIQRVFHRFGSPTDFLVGTGFPTSASVSGPLSSFPVDGGTATITLMFCVGLDSQTIPPRACTNFFNIKYEDSGFCSGGGRGGGGGGSSGGGHHRK